MCEIKRCNSTWSKAEVLCKHQVWCRIFENLSVVNTTNTYSVLRKIVIAHQVDDNELILCRFYTDRCTNLQSACKFSQCEYRHWQRRDSIQSIRQNMEEKHRNQPIFSCFPKARYNSQLILCDTEWLFLSIRLLLQERKLFYSTGTVH